MDQALTHWLDANSIHPNDTVFYNSDRETLVRELCKITKANSPPKVR